jgi:hypothetical protein
VVPGGAAVGRWGVRELQRCNNISSMLLAVPGGSQPIEIAFRLYSGFKIPGGGEGIPALAHATPTGPCHPLSASGTTRTAKAKVCERAHVYLVPRDGRKVD